VIHAVNFAVRAGLTFGGIGRGQGAAMLSYLGNRVKASSARSGPGRRRPGDRRRRDEGGLTVLSDQPVPEIPGLLLSRPAGDGMVQAGWEARASR